MRDWDNDVVDWNDYRVNDYFSWARDTYGKDAVEKGFIYADQYRALMDIHSIDIPETEPFVGEIKIP
jgi:hypothetical protein